jgi:hypothetical protein
MDSGTTLPAPPAGDSLRVMMAPGAGSPMSPNPIAEESP